MATEVKYQVFTSSTYEDLRDWRKGLIEKILELEHISYGMESFSAGTEEDWLVIKKAIDQCDIYVVLVGACFGSTFRNTGESFTQREFYYARDKAKKPILAFVLDDDEVKTVRKQFAAEILKSEKQNKRAEAERANESKLQNFREEVKKLDAKGTKQRIVDTFRSVDDLKSKFGNALDKLIHKTDFRMPGWQRFSADVGKNRFIQKIVSNLSGFDKLSERCVVERPELKEATGNYFWGQWGSKVTNAGIRHLYFESGSSIAFASSEFLTRLSDQAWQRHREHWRIKTNNILTYLEFVLCENIHVDLYPHGPPEPKYGATFGSLKDEEEEGFPEHNIALSRSAPNALCAVKALADQVLPRDKPSLILGAASGLELASNSEFPGPHVGTYYNKLFKRVLLESRHPLILFLDEKKISPFDKFGRFKIGECHNVCDEDISWKAVCVERPIAICIGASTKKHLEKIVSLLDEQGLKNVGLIKRCGEAWVTLVRNSVFDSQLGKVPILTS
ncbi:DUF4062 domain-containing protein [Candidatus Peregrinibacteria bacterium]|nr:DUF4062 domain-containing protein [Candidatus Peregrinibacteria bacterium]